MSDVALVALITGSSTLVAGLAGIIAGSLNSHKERELRLKERREDYREWYRHTLFERQLQAAQEALTWERRLRMAVNQVHEGRAKGKEVADLIADVSKLGAEARDWYEQNAAYLEYPKASPVSDFWGLLNSIRGWDGQNTDIDKSLNDLYTFLYNRINWLLAFGGKYEEMKVDDP